MLWLLWYFNMLEMFDCYFVRARGVVGVVGRKGVLYFRTLLEMFNWYLVKAQGTLAMSTSCLNNH